MDEERKCLCCGKRECTDHIDICNDCARRAKAYEISWEDMTNCADNATPDIEAMFPLTADGKASIKK